MSMEYKPGSLWKVRKHELVAFDENGFTHYLRFGSIFMLLDYQKIFQQDGKDAGEHLQILFNEKTLYVSFIDMGHDIKLYTEKVAKEEKKQAKLLLQYIEEFQAATKTTTKSFKELCKTLQQSPLIKK